MNTKIAFIVLFISSHESLGQNLKYLRNHDSNIANMGVFGDVGSDSSELKSSYDHGPRDKSSKTMDEEHMQFFDKGASWKRFLGMSMGNDPKEHVLSYNLINDSRSKKNSSKKSSKKTSSSSSNESSSESTTHNTSAPLSQYSYENIPQKYKTPMASNTTKEKMATTSNPTQNNVIKIVIPTPLPTQKEMYLATERPSTITPSLLSTSQKFTTPAHTLSVSIPTPLPTSKRGKPTERPSQMHLSMLPTSQPIMHQTYEKVVSKSKCNARTVESRKIAVENLLTQSSVDSKSTTKNEAFRWLTEKDEGCSIGDHGKILQRYILASFYFATSGDGWSRCNRNDEKCQNKSFLSSKSECEWFGVKCNQDGFVTNIYVGKIISV